jgi:serine protease AprX
VSRVVSVPPSIPMKKALFLAFAASMICLGQSQTNSKRGPLLKMSSDLLAGKSRASNSLNRVLIQWDPNAANTSSKITSVGGRVRLEFTQIRAGSYWLPDAAITTLAQDPDVRYISVDRKVRRKLANVAAAIGAPGVWRSGYTGNGIGVAVIDSGINPDSNLPAIAYSEDFVSPSDDSNDRLWLLGRLSLPLLNKKGTAPDWYGHGHHIAGIIASNGFASRCLFCTSTLTGIAPSASLINLRVLDGMGEGNESDVISAIERAIELKNKYNIRVINLSLGRPVFESYQNDPLCQEVEAAWKAGIVVVVAAGNDGRDNSFGNEGYGTILSPGNDPYVITVGSMKGMGTPERTDDLIASYSAKGPTAVDHIVKPDILAPGNQIISLRASKSRLPLEMPLNISLLSSYQMYKGRVEPATQPAPPTDASIEPADAKIGKGYSDTYLTLSGTSMAAGVVSAAVADLLQANPSLTPDQVKMLLMKTATKTFPESSSVVDDAGNTFTSYYDLFTVGAGYLDLGAAIAQAKKVPTGLNALSPTAVYNAASGDITLNFDPSSVFSERAMWGSSTVASERAMWGSRSMWGSNVIDGERAMWGSRATWGSSTTDAQRAMWGSSGIWSERAMWGSSTVGSERAMWGSSSNQSETVLTVGEK